jgi:TRAP-type transport system periplasmic protein
MNLIGSLAGAMLIIALAMASPADAQIITLQIESPIPPEQPTSLSMAIFSEEVTRLSKGTIEVKLLPGSGRSIKETIDAVHVGELFGTWMSISNFSRLVPESTVVGLPFVFENHVEARRAIVDGPAGALIAAKLEAKGFIVLTWMDGGAFNVLNAKRPLKTLDDFKGLKIRVMPNAVHLATFQALGVHTLAMDLKDVDAALRQGDVDGAEQEYAIMYASRYFESQKYLSDTAHFLDFYILFANKKAIANLSPSQQTAIRQAAATMSLRERKMSAEAQATALARLQEAGMQFDPLSPETRMALRRATSGVIEGVSKGIGADVVNKVLTESRVHVLEMGHH